MIKAKTDPLDYCSSLSASRALARRLEAYWQRRLLPVNSPDITRSGAIKFWVERDNNYRKPLFVIRTNLILKV